MKRSLEGPFDFMSHGVFQTCIVHPVIRSMAAMCAICAILRFSLFRRWLVAPGMEQLLLCGAHYSQRPGGPLTSPDFVGGAMMTMMIILMIKMVVMMGIMMTMTIVPHIRRLLSITPSSSSCQLCLMHWSG